MELLLNLAWLLLALPAFGLWRASRSARFGRKVSALQSLLALGCMLVILFPVVSATDDLHILRSEIEESPVTKRSIRCASHDKTAAPRLHSPALLAATYRLTVFEPVWLTLLPLRFSLPAAPLVEGVSRAPPLSLSA